MSCKPVVSVILPTYNRGYILPKAISSILNQTIGGLELIVVDDGSQDNTSQVVNEFKDPRIKYIRLERNRGAAGARNVGIIAAEGDVVSFADSDNIWRPNKLEAQLEVLRNSRHGSDDCRFTVCFCRFRRVGLDGVGQVIPPPGFDIERDLNLWHHNVIGTPSVMANKQVFYEVGMFDERLPALEDWELWLRFELSTKVRFRFVPEVMYESLLQRNSLSVDLDRQATALGAIIRKYESAFKEQGTLHIHRASLASLMERKGLLDEARQNLYESLCIKPSLKAMMLYCLTYLPPRMRSWVRRLRRLVVGTTMRIRHSEAQEHRVEPGIFTENRVLTLRFNTIRLV